MIFLLLMDGASIDVEKAKDVVGAASYIAPITKLFSERRKRHR